MPWYIHTNNQVKDSSTLDTKRPSIRGPSGALASLGFAQSLSLGPEEEDDSWRGTSIDGGDATTTPDGRDGSGPVIYDMGSEAGSTYFGTAGGGDSSLSTGSAERREVRTCLYHKLVQTSVVGWGWGVGCGGLGWVEWEGLFFGQGLAACLIVRAAGRTNAARYLGVGVLGGVGSETLVMDERRVVCLAVLFCFVCLVVVVDHVMSCHGHAGGGGGGKHSRRATSLLLTPLVPSRLPWQEYLV